MAVVWFGLKKSMQCEPKPRDVHDPKRSSGNRKLCNIMSKKSSCGRSGCSRSIASLKDVVVPGSRRHTSEEKPPVCSPRSIGSSELLMNSIAHEVVVNNTTCELKITAGWGFSDSSGAADSVPGFVGMLKPGTPGPHRLHGRRGLGSPVRRSSSNLSRRSPKLSVLEAYPRPRSSFGSEYRGGVFCHKCGEQFARWEVLEAHHLSKHAVTELAEGDSSRKIVEIICRASSARADNQNSKIDRILKIHNMQPTLSQFEEYRELVKLKAGRLSKKHPRCLADGNELLRFHGAAVGCDLGKAGSSSLCASDSCQVCRILRHGFCSSREMSGGIGVFTASTSGKALESIEGERRKALIVCRVIAGRVHRPVENVQGIGGQSGFDSVAGRVGAHSNIEELYLLSHRALLPCFVVVYKGSRGNMN